MSRLFANKTNTLDNCVSHQSGNYYILIRPVIKLIVVVIVCMTIYYLDILHIAENTVSAEKKHLLVFHTYTHKHTSIR